MNSSRILKPRGLIVGAVDSYAWRDTTKKPLIGSETGTRSSSRAIRVATQLTKRRLAAQSP